MRLAVFAAAGVALFAAAVAATSLAGCGSDDACGGHSHDPACLVCEGDEDPLTAGSMFTATNGFTIELVSVTPSPMVSGNNVIVVKVRQGGNLVDGVSFAPSSELTTQTWYPAGGHGSPLLPTVTPTANPGEYELTNVNFLHAGQWEMRFRVANGAVVGEYFMKLCIEEAPGA
jgi:hypothetical protein